MSRIFRDTNLFVCLFEDRGEFTERGVSLRERMIERNDELLTSTFTLGEILVKPREAGNEFLAQRHEQAITEAATILPFDRSAAFAFATVRRDRSIRPPDAIQLACASAAGIDMFITNDHRISRKVVSGVHFIQSLATTAL